MKVKDLLEESSQHFHSLDPGRTVGEALKTMAGFSTSALMVMDGENAVGIFTERDLVRCHILFPGKDIETVQVKEVMTTSLIVADPDDTLEEAVSMMIKAKIRHLPIISQGIIKGILSLEDLVKNLVNVLTTELHYFKDYISDLKDAADD